MRVDTMAMPHFIFIRTGGNSDCRIATLSDPTDCGCKNISFSNLNDLMSSKDLNAQKQKEASNIALAECLLLCLQTHKREFSMKLDCLMEHQPQGKAIDASLVSSDLVRDRTCIKVLTCSQW